MRKILFVGLAAAFASAAFGQNLLTNPGFETGDLTGWVAVQGDTGLGGVNVGGGTPHSGNDYFGMGQTSQSSESDFYQDVATVVGQQYVASCWAYEEDPSSPGCITVTFGGAQVGPASGIVAGTYTQYSGTFTATSTTTRLESTGWELAEWVISDDYSVTAVQTPEPASMAVLGLGALALIRRRRNRK
jgi:MYXO-CTERM domain-containing protein